MDMLVAAVVLWLVAMVTGVSESVNQNGFCQVYSYNIKERESGLEEKHLFVCCNNLEERACQGFTYQKPSRTESFCSGQVMVKGGNHWTQMEVRTFPDAGRLYCGGCCGQHLAWEECNEEAKDSEGHGKSASRCFNWVQCFIKQCRKVIESVIANKQLKCSLPPPPHPKHFRQEPRTLPVNVSLEFNTPHTPAQSPSSSRRESEPEFGCTERECRALHRDARCRLQCCEDFCCLPDGALPSVRPGLFGLTAWQLVGVSVAILASIVVLTGIGVVIYRKCVPACRSMRTPDHDTQILVIEGPEEPESDDDQDSS